MLSLPLSLFVSLLSFPLHLFLILSSFSCFLFVCLLVLLFIYLSVSFHFVYSTHDIIFLFVYRDKIFISNVTFILKQFPSARTLSIKEILVLCSLKEMSICIGNFGDLAVSKRSFRLAVRTRVLDALLSLELVPISLIPCISLLSVSLVLFLYLLCFVMPYHLLVSSCFS